MKYNQTNFSSDQGSGVNSENRQKEQRIKPKRRVFPKIFWTLVVISLIFLGTFFAKAYDFSSKVFVNHSSVWKKIGGVIDGSRLKGEASDQVNILILGYGGPGHDGPYLTDTIILASLKPSTNQILLTTVPRDYLWENGNSSQKINTAYSEGLDINGDHNDAGLKAIEAIEELSGLDIPYFAAIDFQGFEKAIDKLGGLEVNVERSFTDNSFPNDKTRGYAPVSFEKGSQTMSGRRALQFARSRKAEGPEASDFARSRRQAKIIEAFKEKVRNTNLAADPTKLTGLLDILTNHFHTNFEPSELLRIAKIMKTEEKDLRVLSQSLDVSTGLVCEGFFGSDEQRQFVVTPCDNVNNKQISQFFQKGFEYAEIRNEESSVILENAGSEDNQKYKEIKLLLESAGITVYEVAYKGLPLKKSVIYRINSKPKTEKFIEEKLNVKAQNKPAEMKADSDLVLIIAEE